MEAEIVAALRKRGWTVTTIESCTGGMISAALTSVAGSSNVFRQGFVTYCDEAKHSMVGVPEETLARYTAVSAQTAEAMVRGGAARAAAQCALSVTGYAGPPSGMAGEETGLVYIGVLCDEALKVEEYHFTGDRQQVREQAVQAALQLLMRLLREQI